MSEVLWSGKPFMRKTIVKFVLIFVGLSLVLSPLFYLLLTLSPQFGSAVVAVWVLATLLYFAGYYYNKRAYTFTITEKSVHIRKSWVFGTYERELTLDQIRDAHVRQGILARRFNCGSVLFVTTAGLEVGYGLGGVGVGVGVGAGAGSASPQLLSGRGNTLWDVPDPSSVRQTLIAKLAEWRQVVQEQRMASALERITEKMPTAVQPSASASMVNELERLSALFEKGAITKEEFEKAKEKLLKSEK